MHLQVTESWLGGRWEAEGKEDGKLGGGMTENCGEERGGMMLRLHAY